MSTLNYVYHQDGPSWIGWLEESPDYRTQGVSLDELEENLRDLQKDLAGGEIPNVRRIGKLTI